jgi:mono/diheme cytochrome c family protein
MMHKVLWPLLLLVAMLTACGSRTTVAQSTVPPLPTLDPVAVDRGRALYGQYCAACHGARAEGAPGWPTPVADGLPPAPPHDDSGHTWHHADRVLYETIHMGMGDPLRPESPLRMPAFGDQLSDPDIRVLIVYFKSLWTEEHRQYQARETAKDLALTPSSSR